MMPSLLLAAMLMTPAANPTADEAIHQYLTAETQRLSQRFLDGAKSRADWEARRPKLKEQFLDMLGLWPLPERTPLRATVTGTHEFKDVAIDKVHFQSRPGLYVTGNLYRPRTSPENKKLPAILYVCGHSGRGRDGNKTAFQDHGLWFASNGYVCLIVDTLQLGEVAGKHHGTYNLERFWWQSRGYTPAGVECWNGIRGIDYLVSRSDVDPERMGVTGISGGGATTVWIAAADDRVKVAVPVSGMSDLESYVSNKVINGHCDCMFFINTYQWEWTTALMLHAPRPLLFANSDNDRIFPMDGNRRIIQRLRQGYDLLGKKENVDEYVSKGGHDYRPDLRIAIFGFLNKHLKGDTSPVKDADFPKIEGKELRVFPEDSQLPKDSINDRADEVFVAAADVKLPQTAEALSEWRAPLLKRLRETSFRALPARVAAAKLSGRLESGWESYVAEDGARSAARTFPKTGDNSIPYLIVVLNPTEDAEEEVREWRKRLSYDGTAVAVHPRGGGPHRWTTKNPPNTVERSLALLGQTVDSGRVRDLIALFGKLGEKDHEVRLVGRGRAGILAAYAAPHFSMDVAPEVVLLDPPASHRHGPHFLNVDRVLDLPATLGLLAPDVRLTLINASDPVFDRTAALYKLAGAQSKFARK